MKLQPRITADQIIVVEKNKEFLTTSRRLLDLAGADNVEYMLADANRLDYRQLGSSGVVVNTSLTNMPGRAWFLNIPDGTLVVLQGRDHDPNRNFESTQAIIDRFPLSQVLYHGRMQLRDPETEYTRYMVIGRK
jgi:protein-L-isoaspartate O-methyltransferase